MSPFDQSNTAGSPADDEFRPTANVSIQESAVSDGRIAPRVSRPPLEFLAWGMGHSEQWRDHTFGHWNAGGPALESGEVVTSPNISEKPALRAAPTPRIEEVWVPALQNRTARRMWASRRLPRTETAQLLSKWEGEVVKIADGNFTAHLYDSKYPNVMEVAEFEIDSEVSVDDRSALKLGARFYWYIYVEDVGPRRESTSLLWFKRGRRAAAPTPEDIAEVDEMWRTFGWDNEKMVDPASSR
ncbi:MAG: hypothetical protein EPO55_21180 [Reyranella sp.]|uniref:hypothetical protein n=1 Tax=Reyranella sp. TaxID=1929291 RepID=UPI0012152DFA|nr:hypothetical protein [Reyranella sp.]TAJ36592.1 MAG: hypothetical protein EPO55_21180 [Reyranella sp.]